ncbi:MAG: SDR family NAD(P)-dependent oxidoreductase [Pseudomonadales bacterium]
MNRLGNRVALITGAGDGIGKAAANLFAQEGARVVVADLNPELGRNTELQIREAGGEALFVQTDVTEDAQAASAVAATLSKFGRLDVLYNCAGGSIAEDRPVTDVDLSVWDFTISLDLKGTLLLCRHAIPAIIESGGGSVINMSSLAALQGVQTHVYSAAKGGVISLTRSMAASYSREGVRVNAICPGFVLSNRVSNRFEAGKENSVVERTRKRYPFGVGDPIDIAQIALFLATDESRMINGAIIPAEGGMGTF